MADIAIHINCGCGKQFPTLAEAATHADTTGHTLAIAGSVKPTTR